LKQGETTAAKIPFGLYLQSRFFAATAGLWRHLAEFETAAVADEIRHRIISRPVYVTSLARAGTTIVTEMLERHPDLTSHRYSDFPNIWTPYWRNYLLQKTRRQSPQVIERAHQDRIQVSIDSPEAIEEVLWMHFFPAVHDDIHCKVLDKHDQNEGFDRFYRDHIRKLLAIRDASRYLAKGNYNIARMRYILNLFPDARFVVPIRDPVHHIASLVKQQRLFLAAHAKDRRIGRLLAMSGHFEFGPGRRLVNFGDEAILATIAKAWSKGREVEGWSLYWATTYRHLLHQLHETPALCKATLLFSYEDLCAHSNSVIEAILDHCELGFGGYETVRDEYNRRLSLPDYYHPDFDTDELETIHIHCSEIHDSVQKYCHEVVHFI